MGGPPGSQAAPLPTNLPFRLVSKTIGCGAYASIRKAIPLNASGPVIAVKFINKEHALKVGRLRPKQIEIELALHASVVPHENIIRYLSHGQTTEWIWMGMELAEGGDLFDKIEADEGVQEDIAHFYFKQLVAAVGWCHSKGVAHRDIKPENMLLSGAGDLKLADFGLATQFLAPRTGERKVCGMVCGSPPYIAPEILDVGTKNCKRKQGEDKVGYDPQISDIWSCAIVLFVLLAGNTPWDAPVKEESYEYLEYLNTNGKPQDELWESIPIEALSLLRGMLKVDVPMRFSLEDVKKHPWFTRRNEFLDEKGRNANPVGLATRMLESLHIDFDRPISHSQPTNPPPHILTTFSATQPEAPITPLSDPSPMDWERPPRLGTTGLSSSQSSTTPQTHASTISNTLLMSYLAEDPSMSQFAPTPSVPMTLTQAARRFPDIMPSHSLCRFLHRHTMPHFLPALLLALHNLNIPCAPLSPSALRDSPSVTIPIRTVDARKQPLSGSVLVERMPVPGQVGLEVLEVRFVKAKGDPIGWRRVFKNVARFCREGLILMRDEE
ncbi:Serine/threonine-protein kinase chk1 [Acrodontium crateriforme]|uniref:non-specific serine/threonine protein kinase n=1 Tax=Acrodontium crateriforme TaxID=150365 RepID=A0AAQ3M4U3_9PEZI|nr:Serine/threonine-protein kinase chk1 [Acrodontium crateriforme]